MSEYGLKTVDSPTSRLHQVPSNGHFRVANAPIDPPSDWSMGKKDAKEALEAVVEEIAGLEEELHADSRWSVLIVFQAMDASGKDSTIKAVFSGVNPAGVKVHSFKQPSSEELAHDFLWRTNKVNPERGTIAVFNRSYYEEVLVCKVHPNFLDAQHLPFGDPNDPNFWKNRYESIRDMEKHLARNGTLIIKFWLNVGLDEQKRRFLARLDTPEKNFKFSASDIKERALWPKYMNAYEDMLNATSTDFAPWYCIPANDKKYMRYAVASIIKEQMSRMSMRYPDVEPAVKSGLAELKAKLEAEPDVNPPPPAKKAKESKTDKSEGDSDEKKKKKDKK